MFIFPLKWETLGVHKEVYFCIFMALWCTTKVDSQGAQIYCRIVQVSRIYTYIVSQLSSDFSLPAQFYTKIGNLTVKRHEYPVPLLKHCNSPSWCRQRDQFSWQTKVKRSQDSNTCMGVEFGQRIWNPLTITWLHLFDLSIFASLFFRDTHSEACLVIDCSNSWCYVQNYNKIYEGTFTWLIHACDVLMSILLWTMHIFFLVQNQRTILITFVNTTSWISIKKWLVHPSTLAI